MNLINVVNFILAVIVQYVQDVIGKIILVHNILQNVKIMRIHVQVTHLNMVLYYVKRGMENVWILIF